MFFSTLTKRPNVKYKVHYCEEKAGGEEEKIGGKEGGARRGEEEL